MTFADAGQYLFVLFCVGLASAFVGSCFYRVRPDESLVRVRLGKVAAEGVRGPALVFVAPIIDRAQRVSLLPQHEILRDIPPQAPPGAIADYSRAAVLIDAEMRYRVIDPALFVARVLPPPAGLRAFVRGALPKTLQTARLTDEPDATDLERTIGPHVTDLLLHSGAADISVKVLNAKQGDFIEAQQPDREELLRRYGVAFERMSDGEHGLVGDTTWATRKVGRMMRWQPIVIAITAFGTQFFRSNDGDAWTPSGLFLGLLFGVAASYIIETTQIRDVFRGAGMRRASIWSGVQLAWTIALGALVSGLWLLADRSGLLR